MALITASEVVTLAFNNANINTALINSNIIESAQLQWLKGYLTEDLYYDVVNNSASYSTLINGSTWTDSNGYTKSFLGLKKCLAFYVKYEVIPELYFQVTNLGLQIPNSEFSNAGTDKQRAEYRQSVKSHADTLMNEIIAYIEENTDVYTKYNNGNTKTRVIGGLILNRSKTNNYESLNNI